MSLLKILKNLSRIKIENLLFSQRPSDLFKKLNINDYGIENYNEQKKEIQKKYNLIRKRSSGVRYDLIEKDLPFSKLYHLKNIEESQEISGDFDEAPVLLGFDLEDSNDEIIPDDEYFKTDESIFEEHGFDDPFFRKLIPQNQMLKQEDSKSTKQTKVISKNLQKHILSKREKEFSHTYMSKLQIK